MDDFIPYDELNETQKQVVDTDWEEVREWAAHMHWGCDVLVYDDEPCVVNMVVAQGYGLDYFASEKDYADDEDVAHWMEYYLSEYDNSLEKWIAANPDKCALPENKANAHKPSLKEKTEMHSLSAHALSEEAKNHGTYGEDSFDDDKRGGIQR